MAEPLILSGLYLSGLYIYPVKSAAGIKLSSAQAGSRGLEGDRRWMVTDLQGKFMTQRKHPPMALIRVALNHSLGLDAPGMAPLVLPNLLEQEKKGLAIEGASVEVEVWGDRTPALHCGPEAQTWLSTFLQTPCQLVYMPEASQRPTAHGKLGPDSLVSFADAYPLLLISEASLADLNRRLKQPVPMDRFRPNLVVRGCGAFAEDDWQRIRMGEVEFEAVKGCDRCSVPGVDQATGVQGKEPLLTLAKYRLQAGKIWFGQNLVGRSQGCLSSGDRLKILTQKSR